MEARVPGVSEGSIASNTLAAVSMSAAVANSCSTTAVPRPSSNNTFSPVVVTPGGGPPASFTRASSCCMRSALTSVNRTTRTYIVNLLGSLGQWLMDTTADQALVLAAEAIPHVELDALQGQRARALAGEAGEHGVERLLL